MSGEAAEALAARLGHAFADGALLDEALTHRSSVAGRTRGRASNERLEFLGDRVLGLAVAEWLHERFPAENEGALGKRHAQLVSRDALAMVATELGLPAALRLSPDARGAGIAAGANVAADALEAVLGAVFLDGGLDAVRPLVRTHWTRLLADQAAPPVDPKTALQEWLQARGRPLPNYETVDATGPSHAPRFAVEARAGETHGRGEAGSKREAERLAAADLLALLRGRRT